MKKRLSIIMTMILLISMATNAFAKNGTIGVNLNGSMINCEQIDVFMDEKAVGGDMPGVLYKGTTLVPMRVILEELGAKVDWKQSTREASIKFEGKDILIQVDSPYAYVNKNKISLKEGEESKIMNSRTMVPIRFISEVLGYKVDWENSTRSVKITTEEETNLQKPDDKNTVESNTIEDITKEVIDGREAIVIHNQSLPKYKNIDIGDSKKIVLDIDDSQFKSEKTYELSSETVARVRTGSHPDNMARVVLDIENNVKDIKYEITERENKILIYVTGQKEVEKPKDNNYEENRPNQNITGKTVVVDAGHGGYDSGAVSASERYKEKDLALNVATKLSADLRARGYNVVMTRETDKFLELMEITRVANSVKNADIFISVHFNSAGAASATGLETWYTLPGGVKKTNDYELAKSIQSGMIKGTKAVDRGVKTAGFAVTKHTKMPSVLVELGFLSNPKEEDYLGSESYHKLIAECIANGVDNYFQK